MALELPMRPDCLPGGFDPSETDPARNDGGPAFPFVEPADPGVNVAPGMSLRDHYAGQAMQACLQGHIAHHGHENYWPVVDMAVHAFSVADAMLKARGGP